VYVSLLKTVTVLLFPRIPQQRKGMIEKPEPINPYLRHLQKLFWCALNETYKCATLLCRSGYAKATRNEAAMKTRSWLHNEN